MKRPLTIKGLCGAKWLQTEPARCGHIHMACEHGYWLRTDRVAVKEECAISCLRCPLAPQKPSDELS